MTELTVAQGGGMPELDGRFDPPGHGTDDRGLYRPEAQNRPWVFLAWVLFLGLGGLCLVLGLLVFIF